MDQKNQLIGENYYKAMGEKNFDALDKYLHPDVEFLGPLDKFKGKEEVLDATQKFATFFNSLTVRSKFGSPNQAAIVYDLEFPEPIGSLSSTAIMTIKKGLVEKIELFYDPRPFLQ